MIYSISSITDLIIIIIITLSSLAAAWRGITKEFITILIWVLSVIISNLTYINLIPYTEPYINYYFNFQFASPIINWLTPFFICLIALTFVNVTFFSKIFNPINFIIDKFLGFIFGIFRGIFIICIVYLTLIFFIGSETYLPNDIKKSYFLKITKNISINSLKILPLKYTQNLLSNLNNEISL